MKIILTGATGFLGGWLIQRFLDKSFELIVLRSFKTKFNYQSDSQYFIKKYNKFCREITLDLKDYEAVEKLIKEIKPDVVIHMAAVGDITLARENPKKTYEISSNTTLNFLESIRLHSQNTLFLSHTSDKIYGDNIVPFKEDMKFNPSHIYEAAKISQEYLTKIYAESYGVRSAIIRCGNYFGGYDFNFNRIVPYVIKSVVNGKKIKLRSDGTFTRDFLYIKDAVLINDLLIDKMTDSNKLFKFGSAFNFSLEVQIPVIEIVKMILKLCKSDNEIEVETKTIGETKDMLLNCDKAKKELNWKPKYSLQDGLLETIQFYRSYFSKKNL